MWLFPNMSFPWSVSPSLSRNLFFLAQRRALWVEERAGVQGPLVRGGSLSPWHRTHFPGEESEAWEVKGRVAVLSRLGPRGFWWG